MSGDWLKIECCTPDKPEVWELAALLKIDPDAAFGKLFRLWAWFDQHTESGNASSVTKALLDKICGKPVDNFGSFCEAVKKVGWMIEKDGKIYLPHFDRHNGKTAKNRALTAKRVAKHKQKKDSGNAKVTMNALPREEKRIEENIKSKDLPAKNKKIEPFKNWPEIPEPEQWKEILKFRKIKKARNTQRALDSIGKQIKIAIAAGHSFQSCMDTWERRQWSGFDASWMQNQLTRQNGNGQNNSTFAAPVLPNVRDHDAVGRAAAALDIRCAPGEDSTTVYRRIVEEVARRKRDAQTLR